MQLQTEQNEEQKKIIPNGPPKQMKKEKKNRILKTLHVQQILIAKPSHWLMQNIHFHIHIHIHSTLCICTCHSER